MHVNCPGNSSQFAEHVGTEDVNQDKSIGEKEFALLLQNLEFREILSKFGEWLRYCALVSPPHLLHCAVLRYGYPRSAGHHGSALHDQFLVRLL